VLAPLVAPLYLKLFPDFELVHDRYLYLPSIAFGVALAFGLRTLSIKAPERLTRYGLAFVTALLLTASAVETIYYQGMWQSDIRLFQRAIDLTPRNARALVNLGVAKLQQGNYADGTALLKRALEIQPNNAFALFDLGNAALKSNDAGASVIYLQRAVALEPHSSWWVLLANAKLNLGNLAGAEWDVQQALAIDPRVGGAHLLLGVMNLNRGDSMSAVREFSTELQLNPRDPSARQALQFAEDQLVKQHN
jgi:tetratricopeptide (TPR) repeat protein